MKKMIMIIAVMATAVAANAGAIKWQCFDIMAPEADGTFSTSDYFSDGMAFLFLGDSTTGIADAIKAGTWDASSAIANAEADFGEVYKNGVGSWTTSTEVSAYMVVFDNATIADAKYFIVSDVVTKTIGSSGNMTYDFSDSVASQGAWQAVPEPTSGLLLLLGVAGLALRRKQA